MSSITLLDDLKNENNQYKKLIDDWKKNRMNLVKELYKIAQKIEDHNANSRIARLTGSSASIVGSVMFIVGICAAPLTLGASLGLTIAGGVVGGAGVITAGGTTLANYLLRRTNVKKAQALVDKDSEFIKKIEQQTDKVNELIKKIQKDPQLQVAYQSGKLAYNIGSSVVRAVDLGTDLARIGAGVGEVAFRSFSLVRQAFFIGGVAVGTLFDIYTLIRDSIDVHQMSVPKVATFIRNAAKQMEKDLDENY